MACSHCSGKGATHLPSCEALSWHRSVRSRAECATATSLTMVAAPPSVLSLLGEGNHIVSGASAASPCACMAAASATLLSEEEKAEPCGAGMLALFPLMCCFSSLYKNQRQLMCWASNQST